MVVRPPRGWEVAYRLLGLRRPPPYRAWAADNVATYSGVRRLLLGRLLAGLLGFEVGALVLGAVRGNLLGYVREPGLLGVLLGGLLGAVIAGDRARRNELRWQRVDGLGRPVAPSGWGRLSNPEALLVNAQGLIVLFGALAALVGDY